MLGGVSYKKRSTCFPEAVLTSYLCLGAIQGVDLEM